jgi:hemerythrin-like domain-containing protein
MIRIGEPHATLDQPLEHLTACHRRIEQRLDTLVNAADHFAEDPAEALAAIGRCLHFMDTNGALHTIDEEASLFPRLHDRLTAEELRFIQNLEAEHAMAEQLYQTLKALIPTLHENTLPQYRECAARLRELYRNHIRSEDTRLSPLAARLLPEADLREISREMRQRRS